MGWCSATEIMDAAVDAADAAVTAVLKDSAENAPGSEIPFDPAVNDMDRKALDAALGPFVRAIAEKLRDSDWDCVDESRHFDRFPQEMLGYDNREFGQWLVDKVGEAGPTETKYVRWLSAWQAKEVQHGG